MIVWIHGCGFKFGRDMTQSYIVKMASLFAKKGYVDLSIDYRLREHPKDDLTATITDAVGDTRKGLVSQGKRMRWHIQI